MNAARQLFGQERTLAALDAARRLPLGAGLEQLCDHIDRWTGDGAAQDDQTVLAVERLSES